MVKERVPPVLLAVSILSDSSKSTWMDMLRVNDGISAVAPETTNEPTKSSSVETPLVEAESIKPPTVWH